ncbi:MAG: DUF348 domain-containing protein [Candidatus Saccharibacteria bacterium]|nr:MAG: DUF348 domain-containing protein [Candidatus Saccharibacteria bacterium]
MKSITKKSSTPVGIVVAVLLLAIVVLGSIVSSYAQAASPSLSAGQRLITVHDRGRDRGILTHATTLRAAFEEADITIDPNDTVEPGLDDELVATNYDVNIYRARPVTIIDGAVREKVMSPYQTAKQIAKQANITLHDEDTATLSASTDMVSQGAGVQLHVTRATSFKLVLYGNETTAYTQQKTVGDMLNEKGIVVGVGDTLSQPLTAEIHEGMKVELWRNGKQTVTKKEKIAFPIEQIQDADREVGYKKITTPGVKGVKSVTYEIIMKNGKEVSRKKIQSVVLEKAQKQVEIVGAKVEGPEEIMSKIRSAAAAKGIDAQRVLLIARCESGFNPRSDSGFYKGLFQHDPNYWPSRAARYGFAGASYFDVDAQIGVSTSMMAGGGWSHWGCDPGPQ